MDSILLVLQVAIALAIFNVWIIRYGKATPWRGGDARNMAEEFEHYGLPPWVRQTVGFLKLTLATLLVVGIWYEAAVPFAALGIALLMAGAVLAHVRVRDPLRKALPAFSLLVLSSVIAVGVGL
jgi:hypothetical protein